MLIAFFIAVAQAQTWGGALPRPRTVPPVPPAPTEFTVSEDDQAGRVARRLALFAQSIPNIRAQTRGAVWETDEGASWSIRSSKECLAHLDELQVTYLPVLDSEKMASVERVGFLPPVQFRYLRQKKAQIKDMVPTPVILVSAINGIVFEGVGPGKVLLFACELVGRLHDLAAVLRELGYTHVGVLSAHRDHPHTSYHQTGMAIDISYLRHESGEVDYLSHVFQITPRHETCQGYEVVRSSRRQRLLDVACLLFDSRTFNTVITPNYNAGHRNHFHFDIRPDDPRFFLR